jgi:hypothetical protein
MRPRRFIISYVQNSFNGVRYRYKQTLLEASPKERGARFLLQRSFMKGIMAGEKDKILSGLRDYHVQQFPLKWSNVVLGQLQSDFEPFAEIVTNGLLSFVSGKAGFVDSSSKLTTFRNKVVKAAVAGKEDSEQILFLSKIDQLISLVDYAKGCSFKLRRVAAVKVR